MPYWQECHDLYQQLNDCLTKQNLAKLLNKCQVQEDALKECVKVQYIKKKRESRQKAREKQERLDKITQETGLPPLKGTALKPLKKKESEASASGDAGAAPTASPSA